MTTIHGFNNINHHGFNIINHSGFNNTNLSNTYQEPYNSNMSKEPASPEHDNNLNIDDIVDMYQDTTIQSTLIQITPIQTHIQPEYASSLSIALTTASARGSVIGKTKSKHVNGGSRKKKKTKAGFKNIGRGVWREGGGALAKGDIRSCLPDALWMLLKQNLGIDVTNDQVRAIMPIDGGDTPFSSAQSYAQQHGQELQRVSHQFQSKKGGPELAVLNAKGLYLIQVAISDDTDTPNLHCIAYDGATLRDNDRYTKVKELDATDSESTQNARAVFRSLFPGARVVIRNIYQLVPM
jgi:hypothetical protein